jgi:phosphate starvation-inducible PhoH-like protein
MSARQRRREERAHLQADYMPATSANFDEPRSAPTRLTKLVPKTDTQGEYAKAIDVQTLIFGTGPAGTGKTYVATMKALYALKVSRTIKKIILTRPAVEVGERLGFLPGTMDEKIEPYMRPFRDIMVKAIGANTLECDIKNGKIEPRSIGHARGSTWDDCWVLIDEAQNLTPVEMKMLLTRIGDNCKVIVSGDVSQRDIPGLCGLTDGIRKSDGLPGVRVVEFTRADVVRSGLVQMLVERYEQRPASPPKTPGYEPEDNGVLRIVG